jgi:hypothetical protein
MPAARHGRMVARKLCTSLAGAGHDTRRAAPRKAGLGRRRTWRCGTGNGTTVAATGNRAAASSRRGAPMRELGGVGQSRRRGRSRGALGRTCWCCRPATGAPGSDSDERHVGGSAGLGARCALCGGEGGSREPHRSEEGSRQPMWSSSGWTALRRGGRWLELDGDEEGSKRGNDVAALGGGGLSAEHDAS